MTTADDERRSRGRRMFEEVNGFPAPEPANPLTEHTIDHVFADVWTRPGLTRKERRWIAIIGVASAGAEAALRVHLTSALQSGDLTVDELREAVAQFAIYQGYPRATTFHLVLEEVAARLTAPSDR